MAKFINEYQEETIKMNSLINPNSEKKGASVSVVLRYLPSIGEMAVKDVSWLIINRFSFFAKI